MATYAAVDSPNEFLRIDMGLGYYTILPHKLLLANVVYDDNPGELECIWSKESEHGEVVFERPNEPIAWATANKPGKYVFKIQARNGQHTSEAKTNVNDFPLGDYNGNPILPGMFPDPVTSKNI